MNARDVVVDLLLLVGILGCLLGSVGLLLFRNIYDQLHFLAPVSLAGGFAIPAAVAVHEGLSQAGAKAIVIAVLLLVANPVLSHATARAARIRHKAHWPALRGENTPGADTDTAT